MVVNRVVPSYMLVINSLFKINKIFLSLMISKIRNVFEKQMPFLVVSKTIFLKFINPYSYTTFLIFNFLYRINHCSMTKHSPGT